MANITGNPFAFTDGTLKVGADNFETAISSVELVPTVPTFSFAGIAQGSTFNFSGQASWVANITAAQDWATSTSLANYLFANQGKSVIMDFAPIKNGTTFRATVTLVPATIGGAANTVPTFTVALQVQGQPVKVTV